MVLVTYMFAILGMIAFNHRVYALGDDAFQRYLGDTRRDTFNIVKRERSEKRDRSKASGDLRAEGLTRSQE